MPINVPGLILDLPQLLALYEASGADISSLPPKATRKLVDYAIHFQIPPTSPLYMLFALIDAVEAQNSSTATPPATPSA